jgi:glycosyltransferase involved in cell wall biosynthesis
VCNGEAFLAEAVESIHQQGYRPLEIIIVDDGSTDDTRRIAERLKGAEHYVYQQNRGLPAARNRGLVSRMSAKLREGFTALLKER